MKSADAFNEFWSVQSEAGLPRMSMSSPSWIFWSPCSRPSSRVDVLVFVHSLRGRWASFWDTKQESQAETRNLEIQDGEYVDILQRPDQKSDWILSKRIRVWFSFIRIRSFIEIFDFSSSHETPPFVHEFFGTRYFGRRTIGCTFRGFSCTSWNNFERLFQNYFRHLSQKVFQYSTDLHEYNQNWN